VFSGVLVQARDRAALSGGSDSAARDRARAGRDGPERMCIVTRERRAPEELIRFVLGPEGTIVPDIRAKLPGRGVWVTARADLVEQAVRRQAFARGLRAAAKADRALPAEVDALIERDCLQSLSLANKAGAVVTGFTRVETAIAGGNIALLLHASDAGVDGMRKLSQALRRRFGEDGPPGINLFASSQLDLALGRSNVIHAALKAEPASKAFLARCRRLVAYRAISLADDPQVIDMSPEAGSGAIQVSGFGLGTQE
jgi:predicted RNA-binding protein YlxR (DUF448 family)